MTPQPQSARPRARVRAPELRGAGGWIGTDAPLTLRQLRGRFVLLDFWTSCCVNCLHVLDELRPLEQRFAAELVVIGVHSPKFAHEADHAALLDAVERYEVHHPVLDDPDLESWSQYAVRAWPTLVLVDPEGYVVHTASGEGHGEGLGRLLQQLVAEHDAKGTLQRGDGPYVPPPAPAPGTALRFPTAVLPLPDGTLLVADTGHHSLVVMSADGQRELRRFGTGDRGLLDGTQPRFAEPQGMCLLPGGRVLVADTANHVLRTLDLATGTATTVAGTGAPWRPGDPTAGAARQVPLSSPWDVTAYEDRVVVAVAGTHQLWAYDGERVEVLAGTTGEGLRDGPAAAAYLAQPSGLAAGPDRLWFVDAETSALRWYRQGAVGTAVGSGLFDFGHRDGPAGQALLQHPLGVCLLVDGSVAVLDTYNGAVRRYDPATGEVGTLATGLAEPTGAALVDGRLLVVESAAHRLVEVEATPVALSGEPGQTRRPVTDLPPGPVRLDVAFEPPPGQHLDDRDGPATRLTVTASPPALLLAGGGTSTALRRELVLADGAEGVLHVAVAVASCDEDAEHPACHLTQQDWGIPVRVRPSAPAELRLVLRGS